MKTVRLGDVAEVVSGATPKTGVAEYWGGENLWITPAELSRSQSPIISSTERTLTDAGLKSCAAKILPEGSVLLSSRAPIGLVGITGAPMATNQGFKSLVPGPDVFAHYLFHWLRSHRNLLESMGTGATFKELSKRSVESIVFPLPSLQDQRRIASILDRADAQRAHRYMQRNHWSDLIPSAFRKVSTSSELREIPFSDVVRSIDSGRSLTCESRPALPGEPGILKLSAVAGGSFRALENKAYTGEFANLPRRAVEVGDVLMTRKNTRDLVGSTAVVRDAPPNLYLPDLIYRLSLDGSLADPTYFSALMMSSKLRSAVQGLAGGSAASMVNVSQARLGTLSLPLPPLSIQREFAAVVEKIDVQRARVERALALEDELFASLQHRAFRGEL